MPRPAYGRNRKQNISIEQKLTSLLRAMFLAGRWDDPAQVLGLPFTNFLVFGFWFF